MKGTKSINGFSEKNSHLASWALLDLKMAHPHNSGSTVRIFFKFCVMKRANRQTRVVLMVGTKKVLFRTNGHSEPENGPSS